MMEYDKVTKSFSFSLNDPATGVQKAYFQIKQDGKAYIDGARITTVDDAAPGGLFQFDYKIKTDAADPTPAAKFISFDNVTFATTTKLYINKKDRTNTDMSLFLKAITNGDWFNIHDNGNINDFVAFDVTGDAVQNGDVFEIPVAHYDDNGSLTNGERVYIHWQKSEETIKTITNVDQISGAGVYDGVDVVGSPSQGHIMVHVIEDSKGNLDISMKDETGRRTDGGKPNGQPISWQNVNANHLFGQADPANTLGNDGDLYFKLT